MVVKKKLTTIKITKPTRRALQKRKRGAQTYDSLLNVMLKKTNTKND